MFIHPTDFIGEINIPNTDAPGVADNLNYFIKKFENRFLKLYLGHFVYEDLLIQVELPEYDRSEAFKKLIKKLEDNKEIIADYVYKFYMYNEMGLTAGTGVVKPQSENSEPASPKSKVIKAWNEMSEWVHDPCNVAWFREWYRDNDYKGYYFDAYYYHTFREEFSFVNSFNL